MGFAPDQCFSPLHVDAGMSLCVICVECNGSLYVGGFVQLVVSFLFDSVVNVVFTLGELWVNRSARILLKMWDLPRTNAFPRCMLMQVDPE